VTTRNRVPLRTLVAGFEVARERFDTAATRSDADVTFAALFEVVAWAGAVADWYRKRSRTKRVPDDLKGLWYVRNRVLHDGAEAILQTTILMPPFTMRRSTLRGGSVLRGPAVVLSEPTWRPSRRLPRGTKKIVKGKVKYVSTVGKKEYDRLFADQPIAATLQRVSATLAGGVR